MAIGGTTAITVSLILSAYKGGNHVMITGDEFTLQNLVYNILLLYSLWLIPNS